MSLLTYKDARPWAKAIKLGLYATHGDSVDDFFPVFAENARNHGTPTLPKRYFEQLAEAFGSRCEILIVRSSAGRPLSAILCFYFRDQVLAYYAGEVAAARHTAANDLKYWALMKRAAERVSVTARAKPLSSMRTASPKRASSLPPPRTTATSRWPFRCAVATRQRPAELMVPVLSPSAPE